jgi:hypothetical protein
LEEDVMSGDSSMQSQTALLQKLNVANVILIHQLQDANRLLVSLLDLQTQSSAQQRWDRGRALNAAAVERQ